jgi:hypothetical protein
VNRFKIVNLCLLSIALNVIAIVDSHGKDMRASFALLIQANFKYFLLVLLEHILSDTKLSK